MGMIDRLLTIVITATVTSAAWIVAGGSFVTTASSSGAQEPVSPASAVPAAKPAASALPHPRAETTVPSADEQALLIPVAGVTSDKLTDTFTDSRGAGVRLHEAIDIMAPEGTKVVAAASGTVEKLFQSDAGGNTIYVRSPDRETIHYYAHLAEYTPGLTEGQPVTGGQVLGTVGHSGNASPDAPHLHFAIMRTTPDAQWWEPANAINPYPLLTGK